MKVGYIQFNPEFGEKEQNFHSIEVLAKNISADLIVLPELFATGYTFTSKEEAKDLAEKKGKETSIFLQNLAQSTGAVIVAGFAQNIKGNIYNSALVVNSHEIIGTYQKIHLFNKEKKWFTPGNGGFQVFHFQDFHLGVMICWDWIFPESARTLAIKGAEVIAHCANLVLPYCQKAMTTRCLENHVFAITANRYGTEQRGDDEFTFGGHSQITGVTGDILASAPKDLDAVDIVEIDVSKSRDKSMTPLNDLFLDRREDFYWFNSL